MTSDVQFSYITSCIYPTPLPLAGYDRRSIFKWSKLGVKFSFPSSRPVAIERLKSPVCPSIYT